MGKWRKRKLYPSLDVVPSHGFCMFQLTLNQCESLQASVLTGGAIFPYAEEKRRLPSGCCPW